MSILNEIRDAALDSSVDIADLLRKCLVLAVRLRNEDFQRWVSQELNGYKNKSELPQYRIIKTNMFGHFTSAGSMLKNYPIPSFTIPEDFREDGMTVYLTNPISSLNHMVKNAKEDQFQFSWPNDMVAIMRNRVYEGYSCQAAYRVVSANTIAGIIDTVKTRLLEFVLAIENENPNAGETQPGSESMPPERVKQIFNITVMGNVGNLAPGGSEFIQVSHQEVHQGDLESLKKYFSNLGIGIQSSDLEELENALAVDKKLGVLTAIGHRTRDWIENTIRKTPASANALGIGVATELLAKGISIYLGFPP